jgi:hypothetical protein
VQPYEDDENYDELIALLGKNKYGNDWNHISVKKGVNAFIGKLADGSVATVQTMPWDYAPWGCGSGSKGSCNNGWIQFEICESSLTDKVYFDKVYKEACELTAYLCEMYKIDPNATVKHNGVTVPTILCHADSHKLGLGTGHADVLHWFAKHGKTMDDVRKDVAALLKKPSTAVEEVKFENGEEVQLLPDAKYSSGKSIPKWVFKCKLYVRGFRGKNVVISTLKSGAITGVVESKYLVKTEKNEEFKPYKVQVTAYALNIRAGAGTNYKINGIIKDKGIYTIVDEKNGFGKLKSGAGWISLKYTKKV